MPLLLVWKPKLYLDTDESPVVGAKSLIQNHWSSWSVVAHTCAETGGSISVSFVSLVYNNEFRDSKSYTMRLILSNGIAQSVKCLPCIHVDLNSIPSTPMKNQARQHSMYLCIILTLRKWNKRLSGACWPTRLAQFVSYEFCKRLK